MFLMHNTATKNNSFRRQYQNQIYQSLSDIISFQLPYFFLICQFYSFFAPACFDRRACSQTFQTGFVIWAFTFVMIFRMFSHQDMSGFRMQHTMKQFSVAHNTHTNTGSDSDIYAVFQTFGDSPGGFSQCRSIYIRIKSHRNIQCFFKSTDNIAICPCQLWCGRDITIGFRVTVYINRSKAADSQCFDLFIFKILNQFRKCDLRSFGRNRYPFKNLSVFVSDCADHLGSACFQCSQSHICILLFICVLNSFLYRSQIISVLYIPSDFLISFY